MSGPRGEECHRCYHYSDTECRKDPPVNYLQGDGDGGGEACGWPSVMTIDFCTDGFRPHPSLECPRCLGNGRLEVFEDDPQSSLRIQRERECKACEGSGMLLESDDDPS